MMFKVFRMDDIYPHEMNVHCGCAFCKGGKIRKDVHHYKLFDGRENEWYLNIDTTNHLVDLVEKF